MKSLGKLLEKRKKVSKISFDDKDIFYIFKKVIQEEYGNQGTEKFMADFFKNKTLFVRSDSSVWANELWLNKGQIIAKINEKLGAEAVKQIKTK